MNKLSSVLYPVFDKIAVHINAATIKAFTDKHNVAGHLTAGGAQMLGSMAVAKALEPRQEPPPLIEPVTSESAPVATRRRKKTDERGFSYNAPSLTKTASEETRKKLVGNRLYQAMLGALPFVVHGATKDPKQFKSMSSQRATQGLVGAALIAGLVANQVAGRRLAKKYEEERGEEIKGELGKLKQSQPLEPLRIISPISRARELYELHKNRPINKTAAEHKIIDVTKLLPEENPAVVMAAMHSKSPEFERSLKIRSMFRSKAGKEKIRKMMTGQLVENPPMVAEVPKEYADKMGIGKAIVFKPTPGVDRGSRNRILSEALFKAKRPILGRSEVISALYSGVTTQPSLVKKPVEAAIELGRMAITNPTRLAAELSVITGSIWAAKKIVNQLRKDQEYKVSGDQGGNSQNLDEKSADQTS